MSNEHPYRAAAAALREVLNQRFMHVDQREELAGRILRVAVDAGLLDGADQVLLKAEVMTRYDKGNPGHAFNYLASTLIPDYWQPPTGSNLIRGCPIVADWIEARCTAQSTHAEEADSEVKPARRTRGEADRKVREHIELTGRADLTLADVFAATGIPKGTISGTKVWKSYTDQQAKVRDANAQTMRSNAKRMAFDNER